MKSFSRPGRTGATQTPGRRSKRRNFGVASFVAVVAALSCTVSAMAATDLPTQSNAYDSPWQSAPSGY